MSTIDELRGEVRRRSIVTGDDPGYDEARAVHNGMFDKRPKVIVRAEQVADVIGCGQLRPRSGPGTVRARRRPQRAGVRHQRRRHGDRPVLDATRSRGSRGAHGAGRRWSDLGRLQLRHPRLRAGHHRRDRVHDRHRRSDAGRRHRLSDPRIRAVDRQPAVGRGGHRRRTGRQRERRPRTRICSGRCAAAAATSAWSRRSSSSCIR